MKTAKKTTKFINDMKILSSINTSLKISLLFSNFFLIFYIIQPKNFLFIIYKKVIYHKVDDNKDLDKISIY